MTPRINACSSCPRTKFAKVVKDSLATRMIFFVVFSGRKRSISLRTKAPFFSLP